MGVAESLPAGSGEDWLCWRALNRLRTGVGRAKTVMRRWGYLDDAQSVDCDYGEPQTMAHLLSCLLLDEACTADDLATVTERAKACARKWDKIVWRTRKKKIIQNELLHGLRHHCHAMTMQYMWGFARRPFDVHRWLDVASISLSLTRQIGTSSNSTDTLLKGFFCDCSQRLVTADTVSANKIGCGNGPSGVIFSSCHLPCQAVSPFPVRSSH